MTARKALTRTEVILLCQRQATGPILCGCGCGEPLDPVNEKVIDEHGLARKLCEPGSEADRDVLENRSFYRWPCAVAKTAVDFGKIAKAKAQAGETGQYARRQKRGGSSIKARKDPWGPKGVRKLQTKRSLRQAAPAGGQTGGYAAREREVHPDTSPEPSEKP